MWAIFPRYARLALPVGYAVAAGVAAFVVWLVATTTENEIDSRLRQIPWIMGLDLVLILVLAAAVGWRLVGLIRRRKSDAGTRLHLRFATLFAAVAVVPSIVVAVFFGVLVTRGVDNWFGARVETAIAGAGDIADAYMRQESVSVGQALYALGDEIATADLPMSPLRLSDQLQTFALSRGLDAVYVLNRRGQKLGAAAAPSIPYEPPAEKVFAGADATDIQANVGQDIRIMISLAKIGHPGLYLYAVRKIEPKLFSSLTSTDVAIAEFRKTRDSRERVQAAIVLVYVNTVLLVLVGAAWLGIAAAGSIANPVAKLVQAADRVAGGDLTARVETGRDPEEISVLSRAFNRMTSDLQNQQQALRTASVEAQNRSRFIETVLSGVSAGVIGLDAERRISAVNGQALTLLARTEQDALGSTLATVAPEFAPLLAGALSLENDHDVDVTRGSETRRLRVRVSGGEQGGLVLTFDDITRLITAQRNAAWRDVARRIAHEIKNPLTPIQLSAERIRRKYRDQLTGDLETFDRCTDTIVRQVADIGRMVDEFSSFARMPAPNFAEEDAAELLRRAVFAQRVADPETQIDLEEPGGQVSFVADGRMVGQALTNVLKNAGEAMAAKHAADPSTPRRIRARLAVEGESLAFIVEDNGIGLPAKDRDRLTEPYVTTREKGTGLGLAIVKRICEDHGGELQLGDATELSGARVTLCFPRTRKAVARPPATAA